MNYCIKLGSRPSNIKEYEHFQINFNLLLKSQQKSKTSQRIEIYFRRKNKETKISKSKSKKPNKKKFPFLFIFLVYRLVIKLINMREVEEWFVRVQSNKINTLTEPRTKTKFQLFILIASPVPLHNHESSLTLIDPASHFEKRKQRIDVKYFF